MRTPAKPLGCSWKLAHQTLGGWTITDADGRVVALQGFEATEAEMRLAAAAPKLLEACEAFMELFQDPDMQPEDEYHLVTKIMRLAVTKATLGDSPR